MWDNLTYSADALIILLYIISLVIFFLSWPHKVYEAILGSLIAVGAYFAIYHFTFTQEIYTSRLMWWNWSIEHRYNILWWLKLSFPILYIATPLTLGVNVIGVVRWTFFFFIKVFILSAFFVIFGTALFLSLYSLDGPFAIAAILPGDPRQILYLKNSSIASFIFTYQHLILFAGFLLAFYKILFSHWLTKILLVFSLVYVKANEIFGKKHFEDSVHVHDTEPSHEESSGDEHH